MHLRWLAFTVSWTRFDKLWRAWAGTRTVNIFRPATATRPYACYGCNSMCSLADRRRRRLQLREPSISDVTRSCLALVIINAAPVVLYATCGRPRSELVTRSMRRFSSARGRGSAQICYRKLFPVLKHDQPLNDSASNFVLTRIKN